MPLIEPPSNGCGQELFFAVAWLHAKAKPVFVYLSVRLSRNSSVQRLKVVCEVRDARVGRKICEIWSPPGATG